MSSLTTSNNPVWYECVLCHGDFSGYGNNPDPLATDGMCCDTCNFTKVFSARLTGIVPVSNTEPDMYSVDSDSEEEQEADLREDPATVGESKEDVGLRQLDLELRKRFDALFQLSGHELVGWLDTKSMDDELWYVACKLLHFNMDGKEVSEEVWETLWQEYI